MIKSNNYNNISFDLEKLNKIDFPLRKKKSFIVKLFFKYFYGSLIYFKLFDKLIDSGILRYWFNDFKIFWVEHLKGRPIFFNDFHFLLGVYRIKFQNINIEDEKNDSDFLDAWQKNDSAYLLFGNVRKYSYRPIHSFYLEKYIRNNDKILEYGCGIAPFSYSLVNFSLKKNLDITFADILQINYVYAKFLLSGICKPKLLSNRAHNLEKNYYDVIILQAVLEHIPDPLNTIQSLYDSLKKNGIIIFDYIISSKEGHDTIAASIYREDVLNFIDKNFSILQGKIDIHNSMSTTVVKKIN